MSDGGWNSGKDNQTASKSLRKNHKELQHQQQSSCGDEFGWAVSRIAVAQICDSTGFHSAHRSALDALALVATRYIQCIGRIANSNANMAGRSCCDEFDVIQGLEDLCSLQGFSGSSDPNHCPASSGVIREISQFVSMGKEVPFARSIPRWPFARVSKPTLSLDQVEEKPRGEHIPDWLPEFPDPHTYMNMPVQNKRANGSKVNTVEREKQHRNAESSLQSLQQRLSWTSAAGSGPITVADNDSGKGKHVLGANSFLAPPYPCGDKEVSEIAAPSEPLAGQRLSVLETFAPALEAAKVTSLGSEPCDKRLLPRCRPMMNFKIGNKKKSIATYLSFDTLNSQSDSLSLRDNERQGKKRRAEMILKEATENPHDLALL